MSNHLFVVESPVSARPWLTLGFTLGSDPVFRIYTEEAPRSLHTIGSMCFSILNIDLI